MNYSEVYDEFLMVDIFKKNLPSIQMVNIRNTKRAVRVN